MDLLLSNNLFSEKIPPSLARLSNLKTLDLSWNILTGPIPIDLGDSNKLQGLHLGNNQLTVNTRKPWSNVDVGEAELVVNMLSDPIHASIGNLNGLTHLDLSYNMPSNELPASLPGIVNLIGFYAQQNNLSGNIDDLFKDSEVWRVEIMNLTSNSLSANLPRSLGNMFYLTVLDLHGNDFSGDVPSELGNIAQLQYLDVSGNALGGGILDEVYGLANLLFLNLSENKLQGPIPWNGICLNLTEASVAGNKALCGGIMGVKYPFRQKSRLLNVWGLASVVVGTILITLFMVIVLRIWVNRNDPEDGSDSTRLNILDDQNLYFLSSSRSNEPLSINIAMFEQPLLKLTLVDVLEATNNFCKANTIGDGGFGTVYKTALPDER